MIHRGSTQYRFSLKENLACHFLVLALGVVQGAVAQEDTKDPTIQLLDSLGSVKNSQIVKHEALANCLRNARDKSGERELAPVQVVCPEELASLRKDIPEEVWPELDKVEAAVTKRNLERKAQMLEIEKARQAKAELAEERSQSTEFKTQLNLVNLARCERRSRLLQQEKPDEREAVAIDCVKDLGLSEQDLDDISAHIQHASRS